MHYLKRNTAVYAAFLDLSKAFDKVCHQKLFQKMYDIGIPRIYVNFLRVCYNSQSVKVKLNNFLSNSWKIRNGVRQGGILSPLLFSIYIDDLLRKVYQAKFGCRLGLFSTNIIGYADDLVLLSPSVYGLQQLIDICYNESVFLKLNFNPKKSLCIKFCKSRIYKQLRPLIRLNDVCLDFVKQVKYLGFMINFNLSDADDILRERNKFYASFNSILRKFYFIDLNIFLNLFKTYCMQFYGDKLWMNCENQSMFKNFGVGYHKALKKILGLPNYVRNHEVCNILGLVTFKHQIHFNKISFVHKLFNNPPEFLKENIHFSLNSVYLRYCNDIMNSYYDVDYFLLNDLDALRARITFIHNEYIYNLYNPT